MVEFDKSRLRTDEFKPYIYTTTYNRKVVADMTADGYCHAINEYLKSVSILYHNTSIVDGTMRTEVIVELLLTDGTTWQASGDADDRDVSDPAAILRTAETRAFKRACARALDITKADLNFDNYNAVEEEAYSPFNSNSDVEDPRDRARGRTISPKPEPVKTSDIDLDGDW